MTDERQPAESLDPSGNYGPTEHGPDLVREGVRRLLSSAVWGGTPARVTSENGMDVTPWNPDCSWYQYGKHYGLNGCQHPGMDVSLPVGTPLYAAVGGKVVHAGHSGFYLPNHVNIETDDGEVHIYGHMSVVDPNVRTGVRVETGQVIGESGDQNGPHLHAERRVPNSSCSSGYCSENPEPVLVAGGRQQAFAARDRIRVADPPLNLREAATTAASILRELTGGQELCVVSGPLSQEGYDWYEVTTADDETRGFVAGRFCQLVAESACQ